MSRTNPLTEMNSYRFTLALYGAFSFILSSVLATNFDPKIFALLHAAGIQWQDSAPNYVWGHKVIWLALPAALFLFFAPKVASPLQGRLFTKSQGFAIFEFAGFVFITSISFLNFGFNPSLFIQFVGFGFVLAATEYLRGFFIDFSFVNDKRILREARMEKLKHLHKKWFAGISALVTVSVAVCVTAVIKLYDVWREDFGVATSELLIQIFVALVLFAGLGLLVGPFAHLMKILGTIEDQFEKIESDSRKTRTTAN